MLLQFTEYFPYLFFVFRIHSLRRLIHQKDSWSEQKDLRKSKSLLFTTA